LGPRSNQILEPGVRVRLVLFQGARGFLAARTPSR
jgi:hypothetical protein